MKSYALSGFALFPDNLAHALEFLGHFLISGDDLIESIGNFSGKPSPSSRKANRKISITHGLESREDRAQVG